MPKRRYCKYTFEDTQRALEQQLRQLNIEVVANSVSRNGRRVGLKSDKLDALLGKNELGFHYVIILARSSHWYRYSLNAYKHGMEAAIVGTHDSCLEVPVLAMDDLEWYDVDTIRFEKLLAPGPGTVDPTQPMDIKTNPDKFEVKYRKSHYGHCVLVGARIRGRKDALDRLSTLSDRTYYFIMAEVTRLRKRRSGRPLNLWDEGEEAEEGEDANEKEFL